MSTDHQDQENTALPVRAISLQHKNVLRQIAKDSVIEPFEGRKSLETIQKTRSGLEKGVTKIKSAGSKAGKAITSSKIFQTSKSKLSQVSKKTTQTAQSGRINDLLKRLNKATEEIQKSAKKGYKNIEEKAKEISLTYTRKGLEYLLFEDTESWILDRANPVLNRSDLDSIETIRQLDNEERTRLIDALYPYNSPNYKNLKKTFETTLNVSLGAIVASNLPGTAIAVSAINMGKTLVKLGHRINIMSAIYGYRVSSPKALFRVSASILQSIDDWENNPEHKPLNFQLLDELYRDPDDDDKDSFQKLLNAVIRKDAYIAVPGIGMISLGKVNLDDLKIDIVVQHLIQNYFNYHACLQQYTQPEVEEIIRDFALIYAGLVETGYQKRIRKLKEARQLDEKEGRWKTRLKLFAGIDLALKESSTTMDRFAADLYELTRGLTEKEKQKTIQEAVAEIFQ